MTLGRVVGYRRDQVGDGEIGGIGGDSVCRGGRPRLRLRLFRLGWDDLRRPGGMWQAVDPVNVRDGGQVSDGEVGGIRGDGVGGR